MYDNITQDKLEAVQRMQDYIKNHIQEEITLADLARASLFSPWYSHRLFTQYTQKTPADYIRRLRLSKSALKLRDESCKIADVAFEFGFGSVDGYQRAFYREFGCNPKEYASNPVPIYLFTPYKIEASFIDKNSKMKNQYVERNNECMEKNNVEKVQNIFIQVIEKPKRKVILKRGKKAKDYFAYCEEVGCDVWGLLTSIKSISGEPVCLWLPKSYIKEGTSEYVQGVEVALDYAGEISEGFEVIELPAAKYLMFQGEPFAEEDYGKAIEQVWDAIKKYDPAILGLGWDEQNPRIQLEPIGTRGYIELLAVKPLSA